MIVLRDQCDARQVVRAHIGDCVARGGERVFTRVIDDDAFVRHAMRQQLVAHGGGFVQPGAVDAAADEEPGTFARSIALDRGLKACVQDWLRCAIGGQCIAEHHGDVGLADRQGQTADAETGRGSRPCHSEDDADLEQAQAAAIGTVRGV